MCCQWAVFLFFSFKFHLLIICSPPVLPKTSCLPAAVGWRDRCDEHTIQYVNKSKYTVKTVFGKCMKEIHNPKFWVTYLLGSSGLCRWSDVLGHPNSNRGRLVGPENEYMTGRYPTSLLAGTEGCIVAQSMKLFQVTPTSTSTSDLEDQYW